VYIKDKAKSENTYCDKNYFKQLCWHAELNRYNFIILKWRHKSVHECVCSWIVSGVNGSWHRTSSCRSRVLYGTIQKQPKMQNRSVNIKKMILPTTTSH